MTTLQGDVVDCSVPGCIRVAKTTDAAGKPLCLRCEGNAALTAQWAREEAEDEARAARQAAKLAASRGGSNPRSGADAVAAELDRLMGASASDDSTPLSAFRPGAAPKATKATAESVAAELDKLMSTSDTESETVASLTRVMTPRATRRTTAEEVAAELAKLMLSEGL